MREAVEQALKLVHEERPDTLGEALALLQDTVYSFSMKVCGHPQDAEDTMQEVLLKSIPHLPKFESPSALAVWLYKVARNRCISNRRGDKNSHTKNISLDELMPDGRELAELMSKAPGPESAALNSETAEHLRQAVLAVPPAYRMVLVLHDMEELNTAEVAQITGLRSGTVRVRLHRARLLVRRHLAELAGGVKPGTFQIHAAAAQVRQPRCRSLFAALSDYMDGVVDDAVCAEMDRHIKDCEPCQAFLASLKQAVDQCRLYQPECQPDLAKELRRDLVAKYQQAVSALGTKRAALQA
jgi:RNA polymerase sigma-70 factor (ECF subfamily)